MEVDSSYTMEILKNEIASRLGLKECRRLFLSTGNEINNPKELHELDVIYASSGEDFFKSIFFLYYKMIIYLIIMQFLW